MRILITGITGFAGSHLAAHLMHTTTATIFGVARHPDRLPRELRRRVTCLRGDLQDTACVKQVLTDTEPDVLYHLAGQPFVPTAWANPWETIRLNVLPQLNLLQEIVAQKRRVRFVSVSSGKVYGIATPDRIPFREDMLLQPDNPYDLSKVTQDLMALQYFHSHGVPVVRARPFNHIGPRQTHHFVAAAFARQIAQIESGLQPPVLKVGNLEAERDFSDVRDVVRAYALLAEKGIPGEAYNIGSGRAVPVQSLLDMLLEMSSVKITVEPDPARMRPADQPVSYGDISKLQKQTGWQPEISLKESLRDILNYWRGIVAAEMSVSAGE